MAGVFSGSLSTISSGLNSLAAIALRDFLPRERLAKLTSLQQAFLTKIFSVVFGCVGYGVTFLIRYMPGMLELAMVVGGVTNGPIIAVFGLGLLCPRVRCLDIR